MIGDKDIVLAAVGQNGSVLKHKAIELTNDEDVALAAIKKKTGPFVYSYERLINERYCI